LRIVSTSLAEGPGGGTTLQFLDINLQWQRGMYNPSRSQENIMKRLLLLGLLMMVLLSACSRIVASADPDSVRTLNYDGLQRTYILHIPPNYDGSRPTALVLSLHGGGGNAASQRRVSGFNRLADENGFIVVYPNGTGRLQDALLTWNGGTCCGYAMTNNVDDVGFIRALVAELQNEFSLDPKRIYVTGISNGGIMAYRLACEASDLVAAIAPVAGTLNYAPCQPTQPVSVIHFHGTEDTHLPYEGGVGPDSRVGVDFASVQESIEFWTAFNGCALQPQVIVFEDVQRQVWSGCEDGTAVELYTILGGRHAWPGSDGPAWAGGDEPTHTIAASALIWEFFAAHPKP
jgi:polyhydroxybutyrate depolymerase